MDRRIGNICLRADRFGQNLIIVRQGAALTLMCSDQFADKLLGEVLLAVDVVMVIGKRFIAIARPGIEEIFDNGHILAGLVLVQSIGFHKTM